MAEFRYDISQLFNQVFGFMPVRFETAHTPGQPVNVTYQAQTGLLTDEGKSIYGTPVLFSVTFQEKTYRYYDQGQIKTRKLNELRLPYTTLANYQQNRHIINTPIAGNNGTVKEIFSTGDWEIELAGIIIDENIYRYPEEQVRQLLEYKDVADSIPVVGRMFDMLGIDEIVITGIQLPRAKGYPYSQPFRIKAISDTAMELVIK